MDMSLAVSFPGCRCPYAKSRTPISAIGLYENIRLIILAVLNCIERRQMMVMTRKTNHCRRCSRGDVERSSQKKPFICRVDLIAGRLLFLVSALQCIGFYRLHCLAFHCVAWLTGIGSRNRCLRGVPRPLRRVYLPFPHFGVCSVLHFALPSPHNEYATVAG